MNILPSVENPAFYTGKKTCNFTRRQYTISVIFSAWILLSICLSAAYSGDIRVDIYAPNPIVQDAATDITYHLTNINSMPIYLGVKYDSYQSSFVHVLVPTKASSQIAELGHL